MDKFIVGEIYENKGHGGLVECMYSDDNLAVVKRLDDRYFKKGGTDALYHSNIKNWRLKKSETPKVVWMIIDYNREINLFWSRDKALEFAGHESCDYQVIPLVVK